MKIFVVLCTFAKGDEFAGLTEQLGQRLEFAGSLRRGAEGDEFRKNATLMYLMAGKLKKVVNIWIEEMSSEEEHALHQVQDTGSDAVSVSSSRYSAHPHALQTFIEKITTFRSATNYVDTGLHPKVQADAAEEGSYRLVGLYTTDISSMRTCWQHKALTSSQSPITDVMRKPLVVGLGNK